MNATAHAIKAVTDPVFIGDIVDVAAYFSLLCLSLFALIQSCQFHQRALQKLFFLSICLVAAACYAILAATFIRDPTVYETWSFVLQHFPEVAGFAAYSCLICFFAETHEPTLRQGSRQLVWRGLLIAGNVLFTCYQIVLSALTVSTLSAVGVVGNEEWNAAQAKYFAVDGCMYVLFDFVVVLGFVYYGWRLSVYMRDFPMGSEKVKHYAARRVRIYLAICVVCFLVRGIAFLVKIVHYYQVAANDRNSLDARISVLLEQVFLALPELVALFAMLLWMRLRVTRQGRREEVADVLSRRAISAVFTVQLMSARDV